MLSSQFIRGSVRAIVVSIAAIASLIAPAMLNAEQPKTRQATSVYLAGTGNDVDCGNLHGGACFSLLGDEFSVAIAVFDDLGRKPTSARFEFRDVDNVVLSGDPFCDSTSTAVPVGATRLRVMVAAADPIGCSSPAIGSTGVIRVVSALSDEDLRAIDVEPRVCLQPTPSHISIGGVTEPQDTGQRVTLDVYVLLDKVNPTLGREVMEKSAEAYAPLGIDFRFQYQPVSFPPGSGQIMISHSMNFVGGEVPEGFDLVHTLTSKTLNVGGQASCIGGIAYRDRAFSVSRTLVDRKIIYVGGPAPIEGRMIFNYAAKIAAHEIGHTMGGHHHYGNCVEAVAVDPQSCTVMLDPSPFPKELVFSKINGAVIRAHAVRYAVSGR